MWFRFMNFIKEKSYTDLWTKLYVQSLVYGSYTLNKQLVPWYLYLLLFLTGDHQ